MVNIINTSKCITKDPKTECFKDLCLMEGNDTKKLEIIEYRTGLLMRSAYEHLLVGKSLGCGEQKHTTFPSLVSDKPMRIKGAAYIS